MGKVGTIAWANLGGTLRDRRAAFFMFLLPFVVILLVGMATGGSADARIGLVVEDRGAMVDRLVARLSQGDGVAVRRYDDGEALRRAVRRQDVLAGVVVPAGYERAAAAGRPEAHVLVDRAHFYPGELRETLGQIVNGEGARLIGARFAADQLGFSLEVTLATADQATPAGRLVRLEPSAADDAVVPGGFDYTAPSNLVLFVFINSLGAAAGMIASRRAGCERRMLSTPTSPLTVVAGDALGRLGIAVVQAAVIVVVGAVAFDVAWGDPAAVTLLVLVFAVLSAGAAQLLGTIGRTPEQVQIAAPIVGIALGMLGGCMWPLDIVGPVVRAAGHVTPHAWAMDAAVKLGDGAGVAAVATELAVLSAVAFGVFALAVWRLRRVLA